MDWVRAHLVAAVRLLVGLLGLGAAAGALAIAEGPGRFVTYAGSSGGGGALTLFAGLGLIAAGLVTSLGRRPGRTADLALLAGLTWFAPVWVGWQEGPPLVRSVAMVLAGFTFPLVFHLVLAYPSGRLHSVAVRALVGVVYLEALIAALLLAVFRDPYFDRGCWANCTVNSFLVRSLPSFAHTIEVGDRWFVASAGVVLATISAVRLARGSRLARMRLAATAVPAIVFAGAVIARVIVLQRVTVEDPFDTGLFASFATQSIALVLLATGLIGAVIRAYVERRAVARVVANLDEAPAPGSVQTALAEALGDQELRVVYWVGAAKRYVDAHGRVVSEPAPAPGRTVTRLVRNERTIAAISHAAAVPELESRIGPALRLALENEGLQAEALARLEELRASRARIVETADLERRRLERDLHDGAQQRLLALSYDIRLAHSSAEAEGDAPTKLALAGAIEDAQGALEELRELAHGIYPAVLTEAGLGPALATLADAAPFPVEIRRAEQRRYPAPVETAAYFTVAEAVDDAARRHADHAAVSIVHDDGRLVISVEDCGSQRTSSMVGLADRVGALGGTIVVEPTILRVEIPCA
jgi:signal transduction histidine kinase